MPFFRTRDRRSGWRAFFEEARRREVHRALAIYGAVVWGAVAAAPDLIEYFQAPSWTFGALLALLALALPVVVVASWTLDFSVEGERPAEDAAVGPDGVELLTPADVERPGLTRRQRILRWAVPLVLLVSFPFLARWAVRAPVPGQLGVAVWAPPETGALLGAPLEWFLGARTATVKPDPASLEEALDAARRQGLDYLLAVGAGAVESGALSATLYRASSGERLEVLPGGYAGTTDEATGRLAIQIVRSVAEREGRRLAVGAGVAQETASPLALLHLLEGQRHFGEADFEAAVAAFQRSLEVDPGFVPAHYRLAVANQWLWIYDEGWEALGQGMEVEDPSPRWERLLEAGRRYLSRDGEGALRGYEEATLHHPELREGWLGLGEALFHYAGVLGLDPQDARGPLERALEGDSLFAPVGHHLVELALWRGDPGAARRALSWMAPGHPVRPVMAVALDMEHGAPEERAAAWETVRGWDLRLLSLLIAHFGLHPRGRSLADSVAGLLVRPERRPEERLRGTQYRLVLASDEEAWEEALSVWRSARGVRPFDPWAVHAHQAGRPVSEALDMLRWAEEQRLEGRIPDFSLSPDHDLRGAFNALVHEAVLRGDSARVRELLTSLDEAGPAHPSDPGPTVLSAALRGRQALLAGDSARAVDQLSVAVSRTFEPFVSFYPSNTMAPERLLLVRLADALGRPRLARRWRSSFSTSLSFGDLLYQSWMDDLGDGPAHSTQRRQP